MSSRGGWEEMLRALADLRSQRRRLDAAERELVADARRRGVVWRLIADALGVSTTAAHKRFRALDPTSRRRVRDPVAVELDELFAAAGDGASAEVAEPATSTEVEGSAPSRSVESPSSTSGSARGRRRRGRRDRRRRRPR